MSCRGFHCITLNYKAAPVEPRQIMDFKLPVQKLRNQYFIITSLIRRGYPIVFFELMCRRCKPRRDSKDYSVLQIVDSINCQLQSF